MLSIARALAPFDVPLIGVNQGRLGFLTDIPLAEDGSRRSPRCSTAAIVEERRTLLDATVDRAATAAAPTALALERSRRQSRHAGRR